MTSILEMNSTLAKNLDALTERFPSLAERLASTSLPPIQKAASQDGGYCYAHKNNEGNWQAITNPVDPVAKAQQAIKSVEDRIGKGLAPAVVIGLDPGYTLEIIYKHFKENYYDKYINRRIYVILDSTACLYGWLNSEDRTEILNNESIEFYWHTEARRIVRLCKRDEMRSHLFIPVSTLPEATTVAIMEPLAKFFVERQEEEKRLLEENNKYYSKQTDKELDKIIQGKAGRKPRMLIPSHASSTVVQYSVRDTAAMFEKEGWDVRIMNMKTDLSCWRINKNIHDFKPDIYLLINHLRTEDTEFYPRDMVFVTWVQDTVSYINNSENAEAWNDHVKSKEKRRDLIIGYVGQVKQYGYQEDRLSECPMIVNQDLFKAREITPEERAKYECDICFASNRSKETSLIVKQDLTPKLEKFGFSEDILMSIHDHLWEYYRDEKTCVGYIQLEDKIIELPEVCSLIEKLINKDDHDFVIQRIYWELNDVIYRHIVLEWIDEMGDKKLHLYGRGWEDHPRFSKYAKGILQHGEELSLAYQCAKHCLHLNSLEGEHQRLSEIIDAKGNPLTRLSLAKEVLEKQKQMLEGIENLQKPNFYTINLIWNTSLKISKKCKKDEFHKKLNEELYNQRSINRSKIRLTNIAFNCLTGLKDKSNTKENAEIEYSNKRLIKIILKRSLEEENILPEPASDFLYNLHSNNSNTSLLDNPVLESNFFFKSIQTTQRKYPKDAFDCLISKISINNIIPEYFLAYINIAIVWLEETKAKALIEQAYNKNSELTDLYFKLAIKNYCEDKDWYKTAKIDLVSGRLSIKAAGQLVTMSVKWGDSKNVLMDIFKYSQNIRDLGILEEVNIFPIISEAIKLFGSQITSKIESMFEKTIKRNDLQAIINFAKFENGLTNLDLSNYPSSPLRLYCILQGNDIKTYKIESEFIRYQEDISKIAFNAFQRKYEKNSAKCFQVMAQRNLKLSPEMIDIVLKHGEFLSEDEVTDCIHQIYLSCSKSNELFFCYAQNRLDDKNKWIDFAVKDIELQRFSFSSAAKLCSLIEEDYPNHKKIEKIYINLELLKSFHKANLADIYQIIATGLENYPHEIQDYFNKHERVFPAVIINSIKELVTFHNRKVLSYETEQHFVNLIHKLGNLLKSKSNVNALDSLITMFDRNENYIYSFHIQDYLLNEGYLSNSFMVKNFQRIAGKIPPDSALRFISNIYNHSEQFDDLYFKYASSAFNQDSQKWLELSYLDLKLGRMTFKTSSILNRLFCKKGLENEALNLVLDNLELIKLPQKVDFTDLLTLFSQIIKNSNSRKLLSFKKYMSSRFDSSIVNQAYLISFLENNQDVPCSLKEDNERLNKPKNLAGTIYLKLLTISEYKLPSNLDTNTIKELCAIASSNFQRNNTNISLKVYSMLHQNYHLSSADKLNFINLIKNKSIDTALTIFNTIDEKEHTIVTNVQYQFLNLINGNDVNTSVLSKTGNPWLDSISAFIYSESNAKDQAIDLIPQANQSKILLLWNFLTYLNLDDTKAALNVLKKISKKFAEYFKVKNIEKLKEEISLCYEHSGEPPEQSLNQRCILFKMLNPNLHISLYTQNR